MTKKRVSRSDLEWMLREKLMDFADHPAHGITVAIVPENGGDWRALTTRRVQAQRPLWAKRVEAAAKQLRKQYILATD
jgi:hypothetical protein